MPRISYELLMKEVDKRSARSLDAVVREHILTGSPFVFEHQPRSYDSLRTHLAGELSVSSNAITVVGSAQLGFSLNPRHPGRPFSDDSDVDVIVTDEAFFDRIWKQLLSWRYPWHLRNWPEGDRTWGNQYLENFLAGHCDPARIRASGFGDGSARRALRDASAKWFNAFKAIGQLPDLNGRDFKGRLYRSWDFATRYHAYGLSVIHSALQTT